MTANERIILDGVDRYRVMEAMVEGLRVILSYRGETCSPAYLQGISGAAFNISGICPCAPTCSSFTGPVELAMQLGYQVEHLPLFGEGIDFSRDVPGMIARVKDEIRAGRPTLVWHAFTLAEWDVVCGFNDSLKLFYGRGSYMGLEDFAAADEGRTATCLDLCPALGAILIGEKTGAFDAEKAEISALQKALDHAYSEKNKDKLGGSEWVFLEGLACYDRWVDTFMHPAYIPNNGDRYCFGVYRSTHRSAADFLRELAVKYPQAGDSLDAAALHFETEASTLHSCAELLFPGWELPQSANAALNTRITTLLAGARDLYARGMDGIFQALEVINS
jgi:hypothetical protein